MKKLLIVDDEFIVRMGIKSILDWEKYGYTVVGEAVDGQSALDMIAATDPDIVLTDLMMDGMDGFDLIKESKRLYPQIKFIVLSSYNDFENVKRAMKLGASDYIFKMTAQPTEILSVLDEISVSVQSENEDMGSLVQKNRQAIKKNVLYKCIKQVYLDSEEMESEMKALRLDISFSKPFVLLYFVISPQGIDDQAMLDKEDHISTIHFSMVNIADEVLKSRWKTDSFPFNMTTIVSVINLNNVLELDKELEIVKDKFYLIQEYYKRYLNLCVHGVLSGIGKDYCQLEEMHRSCMEVQALGQGKEELIECDQRLRSEIIKAKEYIIHHLRESLTVAEVARVACMSESYFSSVFKKEMGVSFIDYVNQIRIHKAAELLKLENLKIYEICQEVGIDNPNYFSILFKKMMGVSPNTYRNDL